jgi:predicted esterase
MIGCHAHADANADAHADANADAHADANADANANAHANANANAHADANADADAVRDGSEWCTEGLTPMDESACFVAPEAIHEPRSIVILLHGIVAPTGDTQRPAQQAVASNARARGYVALFPRGRRDVAPPKLEGWWAWPTTFETHARWAKTMVDSWLRARDGLEQRLGARFERTYLLGGSNGAYFATALALRGEIAVDGFGAISGGTRGTRTPAQIAATSRPPFFIAYGVHDDTKANPIALAALLEEARWPHVLVAHDTGHKLREDEVDAAIRYWRGE